MSPHNRKIHKAIKLRKRLGQRSGGTLAPLPEKPKGMHWRTYERLAEVIASLDEPAPFEWTPMIGF